MFLILVYDAMAIHALHHGWILVQALRNELSCIARECGKRALWRKPKDTYPVGHFDRYASKAQNGSPSAA